MTKPFDPTKPAQLRDGRPVRIVCTDKKDDYPIIALVTESNGVEILHVRKSDGTHGYWPSCDLVNIPTKRSGFVNLYRGTQNDALIRSGPQVYGSKETAERYAGVSAGGAVLTPDYIATVPVSWEE